MTAQILRVRCRWAAGQSSAQAATQALQQCQILTVFGASSPRVPDSMKECLDMWTNAPTTGSSPLARIQIERLQAASGQQRQQLIVHADGKLQIDVPQVTTDERRRH